MPASYVIGDQPVPGAGYRLVKFLGRGGFGEVWKATAPGGAEAAVKIIRLGSREGRKELRALQLVKRIHHTHLVPIIAFWIKNDKGELMDDEAVLQADQRQRATVPHGTAMVTTAPFDSAPLDSGAATTPLDSPAELIIAMGLGDQNLYDRLEQCRQEGLPGIPDEELLGYLEDSAAAIDFLNSPVHDLGSGPAAIQHCDIKPHNLVLVGGSVQVCDFGLARMMGADRATTAAASIAYAAPECLVQGKPSASTDQYCLAVSFVELKTGQLPYSDLTMAAVIDAKRHDKLDYSMLPEAVRRIVQRATNSDPAKRYGSCREMVRELKCALAPSESGGKQPARRTSRLFVAAAAVVLVAAGGLWAWRQSMPLLEPSPTIVKTPPQADLKPSAVPTVSSAAKPVEIAPVNVVTVPQSITNQSDSSKRDGEALLESGFAALKNNDFVTAAADLEKASKLLPRNVRVFGRLGAAQFAQKQWQPALESYTTAIKYAPAADNDYLYFAAAARIWNSGNSVRRLPTLRRP